MANPFGCDVVVVYERQGTILPILEQRFTVFVPYYDQNIDPAGNVIVPDAPAGFEVASVTDALTFPQFLQEIS